MIHTIDFLLYICVHQNRKQNVAHCYEYRHIHPTTLWAIIENINKKWKKIFL